MTKIEALELELAARKMVEGTELAWLAVIRHTPTKRSLVAELDEYCLDKVELALGIIEGKPVWKGDTLYWDDADATVIDIGYNLDLSKWSWLPPKPKNLSHRERLTVNAEDFDNIITEILAENETYRKALENLK